MQGKQTDMQESLDKVEQVRKKETGRFGWDISHHKRLCVCVFRRIGEPSVRILVSNAHTDMAGPQELAMTKLQYDEHLRQQEAEYEEEIAKLKSKHGQEVY